MINSKLVKELENKFMKHYKSFIIDDSEVNWNFEMKVNHTKRVRENILAICQHNEIAKNDTCIAEVIALLHDIGRFTQYAQFNTFKDAESCDHAEMGLQVIKKNNLLKSFNIEEIGLIETAISYHNKKDLPQNLDKREKLFCELIRDADKLDIFDLVVNYYETRDVGNKRSLELSLPDNNKVSDKVFDALYKGKIVDIADVKNLNDFKLLQIGWIFDINFAYTQEKILENNYIERIFQKINCDRDLDKLRNHFKKLTTAHRSI